MRTLLNVIWFFLGGIWLALSYTFAGVVCCIFIVTIPWGIASFRIAGFALWPFGRVVVPNQNAGVATIVGNIIWILVGAWHAVLVHLVTAALLAITIVGLPLAAANLKMIPVALAPLGKQVVPADSVPGGRSVIGL